MKSFGFQKIVDRQIDLDKADLSLVQALARELTGWRRCIGCGSCSATCTAARLGSFNPRKVQMLVRMGQWDQVAQEAVHCQLCGKCRLVCPRDVDTRQLMLEFKKLQTISRP
jgi:heterodisulfide reductase subunit C